MNFKYIYSLSELPADPSLIGGKGVGLNLLVSKGIRIPETAVVPIPVYEQFVGTCTGSPCEIQAKIERADLSDLVGEVQNYCLRYFGSGQVAVRSSANLEDLSDKSSAGLYESFVDVSVGQLEKPIRACWSSLWNDRAFSCQAEAGQNPKMAILVQPFIAGKLSGVAFSANPINGNPLEIVFNYSEGGCAPITDGDGVSRTYVVDVRKLLCGKEFPEPFRSIATICLQFEYPIDVEWTVDSDNNVFFLQGRPIVLRNKFRISRHSVSEGFNLLYPEPFSRLGISLELEKNKIYNKVVTNLINPRFAHRRVCLYNRFFGRLDHTAHGYSYVKTLVNLLRSILKYLPYCKEKKRVIRSINEQQLSSDEATRQFLQLIENYLNFYEVSIYVGYLRNTYARAFVKYTNWITGKRLGKSSLHRMLVYSQPKGLVKLRDDGLRELADNFRECQEEDWLPLQTEDFRELFRHYCATFAYVFSDTYPRDPHSKVDSQLAKTILSRLRESGLDREERHTGTQDLCVEREIKRQQFGGAHLVAFKFLRSILQRLAPIREERNHYLYLIVVKLSRFVALNSKALVDSYRLDSVNDIYFFSLKELRDNSLCRHLLDLRKRVYFLSRRFIDPHLANRDSSVEKTNSSVKMRGIPCSPGTASGPVVFLRDRTDFLKVRSGSILVVSEMRPFWTPVLNLASGLLGSRGNVLSHGASIAREYGIPAVFGLGENVFNLEEGRMVTLDGATGVVNLEATGLQLLDSDGGVLEVG